MEKVKNFLRVNGKIMVFQVVHAAKLKCQAAVSTHTVMDMVNNLRMVFGPEYEFGPEAICEGGIEMKNWPGKTPGMYKSVRFGWHDYGRWPFVTEGRWDEEPEKIIWSPHNFHKECEHPWNTCYCVQGTGVWISKRKKKWPVMKGTMIIKANHEAPHWKIREINMVRKVFDDAGLI